MITDRIIDIMSKNKMIEFLKNNNNLNNVVLISILDPDDNKPIPKELLDKLDDYLIVKFWDIEGESNHSDYKPIDDKTAKKIAEFIWKNRDKKFLIHCAAGVSRSAGVGLAVECIIRDFGDKHEFCLQGCEIIGNTRFHPNWYVFDKIVEQFELMKDSKKNRRLK